jgi:hypothetical protein
MTNGRVRKSVLALAAAVAVGAGACQRQSALFDPCEGVTSSFHGTCVTDGVSPYCSCQEGYHPVGLSCVLNDPADPCLGVTCNAHGTCHVEAGLPVCDCEPGYRVDDSGMLCLARPGGDAETGDDGAVDEVPGPDGDADAGEAEPSEEGGAEADAECCERLRLPRSAAGSAAHPPRGDPAQGRGVSQSDGRLRPLRLCASARDPCSSRPTRWSKTTAA